VHSGKSSLTLCLLRLMELDSGSISIDGIDIARIPCNDLRASIVALPQDSHIFDDSLRKNIDPHGVSNDDAIMAALQKVRLWDKVLARGGLDIKINPDFFSQGETQLLVFARALIRESRILILDEFTSRYVRPPSWLQKTPYCGWCFADHILTARQSR
jgi:ABC-type multidrug transport system fused ATPase/permease subunit